MTGLYLAAAFTISGLLFLNRKRVINYLLVITFLALQIGFTVYEYGHINTIELHYFTADALGILLLVTLSIISIPAMYHSYVYLSTKNDNPRHRAFYFAAMVTLLTAISAAYLANNIAVTWIFVELTTLSAAVLIYHRRNNRSLEGTWKYLFVCAISKVETAIVIHNNSIDFFKDIFFRFLITRYNLLGQILAPEPGAI